jgi:hypothetical protein
MTNYATSLKGALLDVNMLSAPTYNLTDEQAQERLLRIREVVDTAIKRDVARNALLSKARAKQSA